ncbi:MAG: cytochrome d ubiquinol oxidase subunit II [Methylococcales bacterium]|nr:cytochrome d ubiquinol oxidase subunit II [Methylococcales bacterium]
MFDYETLRCIWWLFLGVLLIGFAVTGGFDLGTAILLPFLGKTDTERRVIINSVGATWEGNQVWFVTAGGALFAAWPMAYAVAFSGFYLALLLTLFALMMRPLGFDYRSKLPSEKWRGNWDKALFVGGFVPALIFGVAFGNLLKGVPFHLDNDMRIFYDGSFWGLLNPFALLSGLLSVSMLALHGATYLQVKTEGDIQQRCQKAVLILAIVTLVIFALAGFWITHIEGYKITSTLLHDAPSNPLNKVVEKSAGLWLANYQQQPLLIVIPSLGFMMGVLTILLSKQQYLKSAFISSGLTITAIILTAGVSMFPFLIPASQSINHSLTVWDASSSHTTLIIMFWVTVVFLPIIIVYTSWVFRVLSGKITLAHIQNNDHTAY